MPLQAQHLCWTLDPLHTTVLLVPLYAQCLCEDVVFFTDGTCGGLTDQWMNCIN